MNDKDFTEHEKWIIEEGNEKQIASMNENRKTIERQAITSGRYPLWLAVEIMTDNLKARWALRDRLNYDAQYGRLPMFRKGDILPAEYRLSPLELRGSDEYSWDDLNRWLRANAPQIKWQFSAPATPGKVEATTGDDAADDEKSEQEADSPPISEQADTQLAQLFDLVSVVALEKMFPANNKWAGWAEHASRNEGLKAARKERGLFNPYLAGMWFLEKRIPGWDLARCRRVLANNLPARSIDDKHRLTGELE